MNTASHTTRHGGRRRILRILVPLILIAISLLTTYASLLFAWLTAVPPDSALERRQSAFYGFCSATITCWLLAIVSIYWLRPRPHASATCPTCGYAHTGLAPNTRCPECSKAKSI